MPATGPAVVLNPDLSFSRKHATAGKKIKKYKKQYVKGIRRGSAGRGWGRFSQNCEMGFGRIAKGLRRKA
jgi:hypothetical protein